jgi:hypothetical protein
MLLAALFACHPSTEVHGMYVNQGGSGYLFPCDDPKSAIVVQDSSLELRYHQTAMSPNQPVFVRLRGVKGHEGSIYGGQKYFEVRQILEVRPRAAGECPRVAQPLTGLRDSSR